VLIPICPFEFPSILGMLIVEMIPIDKEARILTFVNPENNQTLFSGTKKELLQLFIDVKDIADDIQADLDGGNFDEDNVAIEYYQEFADKYNK
jgi:hypothetical protein